MKTYIVTQEDIDDGVQGTDFECPIARCISRTCDGPCLVSPEDVTFGGNEFLLPKEARNFVEAFDAGQPVAPFTFTLTEEIT